MRTTVDLPEAILKQVKAVAAERGDRFRRRLPTLSLATLDGGLAEALPALTLLIPAHSGLTSEVEQ